LIANFTASAKMGSFFPSIYNWAMTNKGLSRLIKQFSGFAIPRSMPLLYKTTLRHWFQEHKKETDAQVREPLKKVYFFCDEFTNYNDTEIGIKAILLLEKLGYTVEMPEHEESGRTWLSKGLLRKAKKIALSNIDNLGHFITNETPLVAVEPSAILTFRDEYPDLTETDLQLELARKLGSNALMIDEFIAREYKKGNIKKDQFTKEARTIKLHGHCQQKAWGSLPASITALSIPENYKVENIPSGCCGMAGSFGYEKEHYDISMQIGELVLFPEVRKQSESIIIAAPGTSCRHQIKDGTGKKALHPVEILYNALAI